LPEHGVLNPAGAGKSKQEAGSLSTRVVPRGGAKHAFSTELLMNPGIVVGWAECLDRFATLVAS
jgi:hypothetical protein